MSRPFTILLPALLLLCGGCGPSDPLEQVRKDIASWSATLDLGAEQWAQHRVPRTYVRQVVEAAGKSLDDDEKRLAKVSADSPGGRQVRQRLADLRHRLHDLSSAVEKGDPASARGLSRLPERHAQRAGIGAGGGGL